MSVSELHFMSAADLAKKVRQHEISPSELLESFIARIEERNPRLNAFVYLGFDDARKRARQAEQALVSGQEVGVFHGVPTAMKDLFDFKPGWVSTLGGVRALKNFTLDVYCAWAERMERAGAIIVGKTNSPVLGYRATCDNPLFGATRNPFDLTKNSGGSSGGSAAAVADGLVPFAEGTDAGGSVRIPAAWCGLYGYKPSAGRVPVVMRPNAFGGLSPFVHEGLLTRTVQDAVLGLGALSGYDPRDPTSLDERPDFMASLRRSIDGWRIAYSPDFDVYPIDERVAGPVAEAVQAFEESGAHVETVRVGLEYDQHELSDLWCRLASVLNMEAVETIKAQGIDLLADHADDLPAELLQSVEAAYRMSVLDLSRDQQMRTRVHDTLQALFADYDLVVTPTVATLPVDNTDDGDTKGVTEINGVEVDPLIGWCLTYLINFTGHPAASIPAGLSEEGLPIGMQIVGRRYRDDDVLAASMVFESLRPWHHTYPALRG